MLLFSFESLALLKYKVKEKFITFTIASYSSHKNKPIARKLLCKLRKESILEIFSTVLYDI